MTATTDPGLAARLEARDRHERCMAMATTPTERALAELHQFLPHIDPDPGVDDEWNDVLVPHRWAAYHTGQSAQVVALLQRRLELFGLID